MALIYDSFESREKAEAFANHVVAEQGRSATVYDDPDEAGDAAVYPFVLNAPVVLVSRFDDLRDEELVHALVEQYTGRFAGT